MAKGRLHHTKMWESEKFAALPTYARLLQIALIDIADDQGRFKAHPAWIRSKVFPYDDVTLSDIQDWLSRIAENGMIILYDMDERHFGQLINWWEYQSHQWAQPSEYPAPEGWLDRVRITIGHKKGRRVLTCNWRDKHDRPVPNTCNEQGKPLESEQPLQTGVSNSHSQPGQEQPFQQEYVEEYVEDKDKDKDKVKVEDTAANRYAEMMESVGLTANYNAQRDKYKKWFEDRAMRRSHKDFSIAVSKMAEEYKADKMNGEDIWSRTVHHLENPTPPTPQSKYEQFIDGINMDAGYVD